MPTNVIDLMFEEALQKGIKLGTRQEQDRIARALLDKGLISPEEVAQIVGLDPVRVREIALGRHGKPPDPLFQDDRLKDAPGDEALPEGVSPRTTRIFFSGNLLEGRYRASLRVDHPTIDFQKNAERGSGASGPLKS